VELGGELEPSSLVELTLRRLRQEILSGALAPGERLVEEHLTQRFGTSRAPLREALRQLSQQGLIEHLPRRGVRVAELSATDADELFGLRNVLERHAVQVAFAKPGGPPLSLAGVTSAWQLMAEAARTADAFEENNAHQRFHVEVVALAGQRHLVMAFEPVILKLQLMMATNLRLEAEQQEAIEGVDRHRRLLDALSTGSLPAVLDALDGHGARTYIG
jgi:DNA-binding GntR family transcriptional regulator